MDAFCNHLGINWMFLVICCMFWIVSPAEGNTISELLGSRVILHCKNESNGTLVQLTWKMNEVTLFSFRPGVPLHVSGEAHRLHMHVAESRPDTLVIGSVQKSHAGNYTCETNTDQSTQEQKWELTITECKKAGNMLVIVVASVVPCACFLVFILTLIILHGVRKQPAADHSPTADMQKKEEDVYENCLEIDVRQERGNNHPHH